MPLGGGGEPQLVWMWLRAVHRLKRKMLGFKRVGFSTLIYVKGDQDRYENGPVSIICSTATNGRFCFGAWKSRLECYSSNLIFFFLKLCQNDWHKNVSETTFQYYSHWLLNQITEGLKIFIIYFKYLHFTLPPIYMDPLSLNRYKHCRARHFISLFLDYYVSFLLNWTTLHNPLEAQTGITLLVHKMALLFLRVTRHVDKRVLFNGLWRSAAIPSSWNVYTHLSEWELKSIAFEFDPGKENALEYLLIAWLSHSYIGLPAVSHPDC